MLRMTKMVHRERRQRKKTQTSRAECMISFAIRAGNEFFSSGWRCWLKMAAWATKMKTMKITGSQVFPPCRDKARETQKSVAWKGEGRTLSLLLAEASQCESEADAWAILALGEWPSYFCKGALYGAQGTLGYINSKGNRGEKNKLR